MHVQVDVDQRARGQPGAHRAVGARRVAARGDLGVDAPRSAPPTALHASSGAIAATAPASRPAQRAVGQQALELGGQRLGVAGLEQQPELAVAQHLLVRRQPRGDRHRAGAERAHEQAGRRRLADRRGDDDVGGGEHLGLGVSSAVTIATRSRTRLRSAPGRAPAGVKTVARQARSAGSRRSARRNSRSAWRSSWSMKASRSSSRSARAPGAAGSAPGVTTR